MECADPQASHSPHQEEEDEEDEEHPIVVAAGGALDITAAAARQLLSQLGIPAETIGKVGRVKLRKITLDIEFED